MNYENLRYLKPVMQKEIDRGEVCGSAIRVIHENKTVYENELGYADRDRGIPMAKDTIFRLYSMTKPITAVAVMILYERGAVNLLDPVSSYLEGFRGQKVQTKDGLVDAVREVTIQDLLNMTSGIVYPDGSYEAGINMVPLYEEANERYRKGSPVKTVEFCSRMGKVPLEFQPGEGWRYGASADVLGAIVEAVSGLKFGEFLQNEIFTPLGMVDTSFYVPKEKLNRLAEIYDYNFEKKQLDVYKDRFLEVGDFMTPPAFESGGAGLVSTIEDYSRFAGMLVNGGIYQGTRILGHKTVEYLTAPQTNKKQAEGYSGWDSLQGYSYGNLMRSLVDPVKAASNGSVGEFGWDGWTGNYFFADPKENLVMIYMIQRCGGGNPGLIRKMRQIIYGAV